MNLRCVTENDLDNLVHHHVMRSTNRQPGNLFPFASVKNLKGFRCWLHLQDRIGNVHGDYAFERGEAVVTLNRIKEVDKLKQASKDLAPTKSKAFKSMAYEWTNWKEQ